ncbi:hypothetical protein BT96DRAFT_884472 [Gymnopus androsaceus JB14]|uniref:Uncharacterized protein n=1 Tax=Gymnopus androsaceus JB14 TaxID=1447944 RepID=A0A6A4HG45_9AGAR|nr:hypothetical protein BT96DRAFT_884472 [Gymnopus androsaceus JB14]
MLGGSGGLPHLILLLTFLLFSTKTIPRLLLHHVWVDFLLAVAWCIFISHPFNIQRCAVVRSTAVNRSIDDTLGDSVTGQKPVFLPSTPGVWANNTQCGGCGLQPPTSSAFDGTYTAATYNPGLENISITFDFTGTALYIFFILANDPANGITASTAANFTIDGALSGTFSHSPNSSAPDFQFNQSALAFSTTDLENGAHQMIISTSGLSENVWVNFDFALYTFQEEAETNPSASESSTSFTSSSSTPSSSSDVGIGTASLHTGAIVGGFFAGLLVAFGTLISVIFFCRRRQRRMHELGNGASVNPYIVQRSTVPTTSISKNHTDLAGTGQSQSQIRYNKSSRRRPGAMNNIQADNPNRSVIPTFPSQNITIIRAPDDEVGMAQIREQIRAMSEQIAFLQSHQRSSWAQGISDEPPPGYDADADVHT